jgi:hypothetical protein
MSRGSVLSYPDGLKVFSPTGQAAEQRERFARKWGNSHDWRDCIGRISGLPKRKFTDGQEAQIKAGSVRSGMLFTEQPFRVVELQGWKDFGRDPDDFRCSFQSDHCRFEARTRRFLAEISCA